MCNQCNNQQTISTNLFNAIYASPYLLDKRPTNQEITKMRDIFQRSRPWFDNQVCTHRLHPMIDDLLNYNRINHLMVYVTDWREMLLEWPHVAETDPTRLAYTQSEDKGKRNLQTVTTLGKYLRRHMPDCPDHKLRDFVTKYTVDPEACKLTTDLGKMIYIMQHGPESCMAKPDWPENLHPYNVYSPALGWGMAYRIQGNEYWGRALVHMEDKIFVRSYKRCPNGGYSHSDEMLEAWLDTQGFTHANDWGGLKVAKVEGRYGDYLMPYIDGGAQEVDEYDDYFMITDNGDYVATGTDGTLEERCRETCQCCGSDYHEDDMNSVGEYGDTRVCNECLSDDYVYAYGRRGEQYYVHEDNAVLCQSDNEYYDSEYLDYHDIVYVDAENDYYKTEDVWWCEGSREYYLNDEPSYEIDDCLYHGDYLPDGWEVVDGELRQVETA